MKAECIEGGEVLVQREIDPKKFKEQVWQIMIEKDRIVFTTIKQVQKNHWVTKPRYLGFDDFIIFNEAIRKINRKDE